PCWLPMRQVGQGTVFYCSIFAISLAQENGGWGITIRHGRDIHADYNIRNTFYYQYINVIYMTTFRTRGYNFRLTFSALMVFATGRSVRETVSAFANTNPEGGLLVVGVSKTGEVRGINHLRDAQRNELST